MNPKKIAIIPGDGIGIDVTREAVKVLQCLIDLKEINVTWQEFDYGAEKYLKTGITLPDEEVENFRNNYDAVFVGAVGDPRVPDMTHARDILLGLRFKLDLYINYRPVRLMDERLCPLKNKKVEDVQFTVFRENTEGLYAGTGGILKKGTPDEVAIQTSINTRKGVERIIRHAFSYADQHGLTRVTMSDKSNAMRFEGDLWQRTFYEVAKEFPHIEPQHWYIDALLMQMVKRPEQFQVIVSCNMFGDIITDMGAQLCGGMGLAESGNIHPGRTSLFEPVHGSAPKYQGQNIANPLAAILTIGLMLEHIGYQKANIRIFEAVKAAVQSYKVPRDLGGNLGTKETGDTIVNFLEG
jgi:3-isopropylmalate dehydrogenase